MDCIKTAKELLFDDMHTIQKDMSIEEWLHRLNLLKLKPSFLKQKIRRVADLVHIVDQGQFAEYEITDKLEVRRLWNMLTGE